MNDDPDSLRERARLIRRVAVDRRGRSNPHLTDLAEHYEKQADALARAGNRPRAHAIPRPDGGAGTLDELMGNADA